MGEQARKSQSQLLLLRMVAGAGSGAITKTVVAPIERVKLLYQVEVRGVLEHRRKLL